MPLRLSFFAYFLKIQAWLLVNQVLYKSKEIGTTLVINFDERIVGVRCHVFQGRFKSILVEKDAYLLELARYIILNPVRAFLVESASEWRWSSYLAQIGAAQAPSWLKTDFILSLFGNDEKSTIHYMNFVADGISSVFPWESLKNQIYLGSDSFVLNAIEKAKTRPNLLEIPKIQYKKLQ
ncbi:Transposase and inactivated derivatives (plasmid) [Legionella adelaidensis]|uniref:Transposase and inactivated derivatives n=1 Tax=Legionella adelaidensis TaxID=45056 RepID=A0A448NC27_9GAMM|nr:Transposase and inactivated derivatives [Legionella adelaidensis]